MYQLSATLKGHTSDVKDLAIIDNNSIASVSRDGSLRIWHKDDQWSDTIVYTGKEFLNGVAFDDTNKIVYYGGKNKMIQGSSIYDTAGSDPSFILLGHENNVCSLTYNSAKDTLISSSWDKTARIWQDNKLKFTLEGHRASVWDVKILPNGQFVTVSADKTIKIWENEDLIKTFVNIHEDVIRHIEVVENHQTNSISLITCSNDGLIKVIDLNGKILLTLEGHKSFVYSVKIFSEGYISCGEDRSIIIWSKKGEIIQVLRVPAVSVWCVDILPNLDIIAGCSDNTIRIFTNDKTRIASAEDLQNFNEEVSNTSLNSQAMEFDESKLSPYAALQTPGKKEGQIIVVKSPINGVIEAHLFSQNNWTKVGDVVGSDSKVSDKKVEYEGKMYDFVFDVDIQEGAPALKLPVNTSDNPYALADKFIEKHDLPLSYRDQIVDFILKNTNGMDMDVTEPVQEVSIPTIPENLKVLPVKQYLTLANFNADSLFSAIVENNASETTFDDDMLATIGSSLHDIKNNHEVLLTIVQRIYDNWTNKLPAFDILRLLTPYTTDMSIAGLISDGLVDSNINIVMLTIRAVVNIFSNSNKSVRDSALIDPKSQKPVLTIIEKRLVDPSINKSKNLVNAISTLLLNFSTMIVKERESKIDYLPMVADNLNTIFGPSQDFQDLEEAAYRLIVTYGNLALLEPSLKQLVGSVSWLRKIENNYGHITRFTDVFDDIKA